MDETSDALWYVAPGIVEIRPGRLGDTGVRIRTLYSGLSRGTERLVLHGRVPASEHERMRCPHQEGAFPHPVKYGYALVGTALDGTYAGRTVFVLHPHQRAFRAIETDLHPVPADVPPRRAVLTANMETALNVTWDAGVGCGDRVLVVGAGVLGLLVTVLITAIPGCTVTVADTEPSRAEIVGGFGAAFVTPDAAPGDQDVVIHTSGAAGGLTTALAAAGDDATVVEASWYGDQQIVVPLGGPFHARRLRLISSQVGRLPPRQVPRWTHQRRLATALGLLRDSRLDSLITTEVPFASVTAAVPAALSTQAGLMTVLRYQEG
jgi:threonine dehydrogenase-like Zn-dependent dehydrogenase